MTATSAKRDIDFIDLHFDWEEFKTEATELFRSDPPNVNLIVELSLRPVGHLFVCRHRVTCTTVKYFTNN